MAHIEFLDETMRDGQQSLWGMRMQAGMALPVAPLIDRAGFRVIDLAGSSLFEVMIRSCRENPWEGLDLLVEAMPRTRVRGGMRSNASVTFGVTPDSLMDAWMRQLNRHGCRSFWIYDVLFNIDKIHRLAKVAKEFGSEVSGAIMFALSPVHTDAYYADKADRLSASPDIDTLLLYDTAGVLDKERLQTLAPAIKARARGKPIEFHANNILGQSARPISMRSISACRSCTRPAALWRTDPRRPRPRSCCTTSNCSATPTASTNRCCRRSPSISRRWERPRASWSTSTTNTTSSRSAIRFPAA
jgi:oxaloacetate decarboxylase alpha subunit